MAEEQKSRLHASIVGRVQGVYFRAFVEDQAERLNLTGWVRNRWDNSVEVMAEGSRQDLDTLLQALREGPPTARVENVDYEWLPYTDEFKGFAVRSTI